MESLPLFAPYQDLVLLIARIVMGVTFLYYGLPKVKNLKANAQDFNEMGFYPGMLWGTLVALLETVGALALILGMYTWAFAALFAGHMAVGTVWKVVAARKPFPDWSYDVLLFVIALVLLVFGSGAYAIM